MDGLQLHSHGVTGHVVLCLIYVARFYGSITVAVPCVCLLES